MADQDKRTEFAPLPEEEALLESYFTAARRTRAAEAKGQGLPAGLGAGEADLDLDLAALPRAEPSADLMARVLGDAYEVQAGFDAPAPAAATPRRAPHRSLWAAFLGTIGGAPVLAGLCSVALAGVWVGTNPPEALTAPLFGTDTAAYETSAELGDLMSYNIAYADLLSGD